VVETPPCLKIPQYFDSVTPAEAGIQNLKDWTPAFAGMTDFLLRNIHA
jgi:hypothetical protein